MNLAEPDPSPLARGGLGFEPLLERANVFEGHDGKALVKGRDGGGHPWVISRI